MEAQPVVTDENAEEAVAAEQILLGKTPAEGQNRKERRKFWRRGGRFASPAGSEAVNPRRVARRLIVATANAHVRSRGHSQRTLTMKNLQEAVSICRSNRLDLPEGTYELAAFRRPRLTGDQK